MLTCKKKRAVLLSNYILDPRIRNLYYWLLNEEHLPEESIVYRKCALNYYYNAIKVGELEIGFYETKFIGYIYVYHIMQTSLRLRT